MANRSAEKAFVGLTDAAVLLGESKATVYRAVKRGDFPLPVYTINGRKRVARIDINRYRPAPVPAR